MGLVRDQPTGELRFISRKRTFGETVRVIRVLQQKWIQDGGKEFWEDVPYVELQNEV